MTIDEYAERTHRNPKTVRRWIKSGLLPARRVPLGSDFSAFRYDIAEEDIELAEDIHERQMKKLSGMSPGLWRFMRRRLERGDGRGRQIRSNAGIGRAGASSSHVECPRCGFVVDGVAQLRDIR